MKMKTEQGLVVEVINGVTKIKVGRHSDCKNCGACPGDNSIIISANNRIGAKPGQRVLFEMKEKNALMATFIVFILPLISTFIGAVLGMLLGKYFERNINLFAISGGIVAFILSLIFVKFYDKSVNASKKSQPEIVRIL
jgi:sigma-E factor negative regulatory protein RseC